MRDPDKNPNIYGTRAYQERVERDKWNVMRGSSQVYTYGGRVFERNYQAEQRRAKAAAAVPPPTYFQPTPVARNPYLPAGSGRNFPTPTTAAARTVYAGPGISGPSRQTVQNLLSGIAGLLAVCFACAHDVKSGAALIVTFIVAFVAAAVVIRYFKQIAGFAVLAVGAYEIIRYFAGH